MWHVAPATVEQLRNHACCGTVPKLFCWPVSSLEVTCCDMGNRNVSYAWLCQFALQGFPAAWHGVSSTSSGEHTHTHVSMFGRMRRVELQHRVHKFPSTVSCAFSEPCRIKNSTYRHTSLIILIVCITQHFPIYVDIQRCFNLAVHTNRSLPMD